MEYKQTLNMTKSGFPMRGGLPMREPDMLKHWEELDLYNELLNKDWFMTFPDFKSYCEAKEKAFADYEDRTLWARKMLVNISQAGYFSSDRTIGEYDRDIWKLR